MQEESFVEFYKRKLKNQMIYVMDAAVSFDGTWSKRSFISLIGVVFVISVDTGEVLEYDHRHARNVP